MDKDAMKDKLKGKGNKLKGAAKDTWGDITGDAKKKAEGKMDKLKGEAQDSVGDAKDRLSRK
ncbi:CsbD family protein [Heyndrickxia coagulans]|uniref:CsbD family protein n=1 Tax=Heyndrickxia coagulans TaxID=1398 RepID=UPI0002F34F60|nr:CsbD family protein [Heyndrickxia coagulans]MBF8417270.1 CsbD family protein [Heyndrickxia coagulans]UJZ87803.1 CsbD family protein [Heyndrickxia coagulans]